MNRLWPLVFLSLSACVPLPFITPPVKIEAGVAVRLGDDEPGSATFPIRAAFPVLQLIQERHERGFDPAVGWGTYPTIAGAALNGPFLEMGWLRPLEFDVEGSGWRWGVNAKGHYLLATGLDSGFAATLQATIEWTSFAASSFGGCSTDAADFSCVFGYGHGEGSIGFFVETSYAKLGGADIGWVGGGLLFRLPASFGIVLVPIWD